MTPLLDVVRQWLLTELLPNSLCRSAPGVCFMRRPVTGSFVLYPLVTVSALYLALPALAQPSRPAPVPAQIIWRTDYNTARKEAAEKGLPLLVVVGTDDCFYCRKLEAGPLRDATITALVGPNFIALKLDATRAPEIAKA